MNCSAVRSDEHLGERLLCQEVQQSPLQVHVQMGVRFVQEQDVRLKPVKEG